MSIFVFNLLCHMLLNGAAAKATAATSALSATKAVCGDSPRLREAEKPVNLLVHIVLLCHDPLSYIKIDTKLQHRKACFSDCVVALNVAEEQLVVGNLRTFIKSEYDRGTFGPILQLLL